MDLTAGKKIDFQLYWQIFWKRKLWFFIPLFLVIAGTIAYITQVQPVYQSSTVVMIGRTRLISRSMERMVPGVSDRERIDSIKRQILSYEYLRQLINVLNLKSDERVRLQAEKAKERYPDLSLDEIMEMIWVNRLRRMCTVRQRGNNFIEISVQSYSPDVAYLWAKTLTQIFIDESLKNEVGGIRGALDFSTEQLEIYKKKLQEAEENLKNFKAGLVENQIKDRYDVSPAKLEQLNSLITSMDVEINSKTEQLQLIRSKISETALSRDMPYTSRMALYKAQLLEKATQVSELMLKFSWRDPQVLRLNEEIAQLREQIVDEIKQAVSSYYQINDHSQYNLVVQREIISIDLDLLQRRKETLSNLLAAMERTYTKGPSREITLSRLEQEVALNREIYDMFLRQTQGTQIEQSLQRTEAEFKYRIIEPATRPLKPVKPSKKKLLAVGLMLGLGLGFGLVYGMEYIDRSFRTVEDVQSYLSLPVLGTIPEIAFQPEAASNEKNRKLLVAGIIVFVLISVSAVLFLIFGQGG